MKKFLFIAVIIILGLSLVLPLITTAQTPTPTDDCAGGSISGGVKCFGQTAYNQDEPAPLSDLIAGIVKGLLTILGLVFVILMIYAGYTWMTSMGQEEKIKKAKGTIVNAGIGLVIIIISYAAVDYIFTLLSDNPAI